MKPLLRAEGLSGGYGEKTVVRGLSLEIKEGDFLGIIGPNGSGKSTLLRLLTRCIRPFKGRVFFKEKDIWQIGLKGFTRNVAFVSQDATVNFPFSAMEMVLMGRIPHLGRMQFETRSDVSIAEKAMALTDVLGLKDRPVDCLSAGERQRIMIARALTQEPLLLFLDEPTSHLDIGHQVMCLDLLKTLNREKGLTVAAVLHDLNLASEYCDRILLLNEGRTFREGPPDEVLTYQNIEDVYRTVVVVNKNPISARPYVLLVSGKLCGQKSS